jgi:putative selenate reductase
VPIRVEGSEFEIEADSIIVAIGQKPDIAFLNGSAVSLHSSGAIAVDPQTGQAGTSCVYAGGDAVLGPATVIEACADGRRAAEAICVELGIDFQQLPSHPAVLSDKDVLQVKAVRARKEPRHRPEMLSAGQRSSFNLVEQTLREDAARSEAARCLQCSTFCDKCVEVCPNRANYTYLASLTDVMLPRLACQNGRLAVVGEEVFCVEQVRQIVHVDDFCNECGNCATFCVHEGRPYQDKPRLFLRESDFRSEDENAFHITEDQEGWTIKRRQGGKEWRLVVSNGIDEMAFQNDLFRVTLSPSDFTVKSMALIQGFLGEFSLVGAAEMYVILRGVTSSLPFLPFGHGRQI